MLGFAALGRCGSWAKDVHGLRSFSDRFVYWYCVSRFIIFRFVKAWTSSHTALLCTSTRYPVLHKLPYVAWSTIIKTPGEPHYFFCQIQEAPKNHRIGIPYQRASPLVPCRLHKKMFPWLTLTLTRRVDENSWSQQTRGTLKHITTHHTVLALIVVLSVPLNLTQPLVWQTCWETCQCQVVCLGCLSRHIHLSRHTYPHPPGTKKPLICAEPPICFFIYVCCWLSCGLSLLPIIKVLYFNRAILL